MQSKKEKEMWTKRRQDRALRDLKIFLAYHEHVRNGGMALAIVDSLATEFDVARNTVYNIRRRIPAKLTDLSERYPKYAPRIDEYFKANAVF